MVRRPVRRWYAEPRIAEAVLAAGSHGAPAWAPEAFARLGQRFKGFGAREERLAIDAPLNRHGAAPAPPATGAPHRLWRLNQDGHRAVQYGPGVVAYNVLAPYGHFEDHLPSWSNLFEAYLLEERPSVLGWAEQRYVNEFTLARAEKPADFFEFYPPLPDDRDHRHSLSRMDVDGSDFEAGGVQISLRRTAADADAVRYQLIVVATSRGNLDAEIDVVMRWHNVAHNAINDAFERIITNETRRRMRQV